MSQKLTKLEKNKKDDIKEQSDTEPENAKNINLKTLPDNYRELSITIPSKTDNLTKKNQKNS